MSYPKYNKLKLDPHYYRQRRPDTVYIDMDGVIADYHTAYHEMFGVLPDNNEDIPHVPEGFYRHLPVIDGAIESVIELMNHADVYFLSSPSWNCVSSYSDKVLWLKDHFGKLAKDKLILSHNKSLVIGSVLIDDRQVHGVTAFDGFHIHFGSDMFPNWGEVLNFFARHDWDPQRINILEELSNG